MSKDKLNHQFLLTLFATAINKKAVALIVNQYVTEDLLPDKEFVAIFKAIRKHIKLHGHQPSLNILFQKFDDDDDVFFRLEDIEDAEVEDSTEEIIEELQVFLQNAKFIQEYKEMGKLFNRGKKKDAVDLLLKVSDEMSKFSIKSDTFDEVISGFGDRNIEAMAKRNLDNSEEEKKVIIGIKEVDDHIGEIPPQQLVAGLGGSGGGKSKFKKWVGVTNARRGLNVLHVQLEGSREEALSAYGATISGVHSSTISSGLISPDTLGDLESVFKAIEGEIYVKSFEKFASSPTTADVHRMIADVQKANKIKIHLVIVDYMELLNTADGRFWSPNDERHRRAKIADELKDICVEYNNVVLTSTQTNDVNPNDLNDPNFKLTRHNVSEAKGIVKPLTLFFTLNRTSEEALTNRARIYLDKSRFTSANRVFEIATDFDRDRFYDRKATSEIMKIKEDDE